jgi:hypothetical protein
MIDGEPFGPQQYRFTAAGPYKVERPVQWGPVLHDAELQELVGGPVDFERGTHRVRRAGTG